MTTKFKVRNLRMRNSIKQASELYNINDKNIYLDFSAMTVVRGSGMLILTATIENMRRNGYKFSCDVDAKCFNEHASCSYAMHVGFFNSLGLNIGKKVGEAHGSNTYVPIKQITMKELYAVDSSEYHNGIRKYSEDLSNVLSADMENFKPVFEYLITEIIRNTFEHTTANHVWITAQRHNSEGTIEVVIADNAEGVKQAITVNPELRGITDDLEALQYAIRPGISGTAYRQKSDNYWNNSGYGLYVTSEILRYIGSFSILSGTAMLEIKNGELVFDPKINYKGTAVVLEVSIDKAKKIDKNIIAKIVGEGEKLASKDSASIKYASKASRMH